MIGHCAQLDQSNLPDTSASCLSQRIFAVLAIGRVYPARAQARARPVGLAKVDPMALIRASGPLSRALRRVFPARPFHVRFWDGGVVQATSADAPTFFVQRLAALSHFLRAPGTLGLGRAYVDGSLEVDDLDAAFIVVDEWEPPELSVKDRMRLGLAIVTAALPGGLPKRPSLELILRGERHSLQRDAAAIRYHYDVGNEFFALSSTSR
jgi:hypothetical protein